MVEDKFFILNFKVCLVLWEVLKTYDFIAMSISKKYRINSEINKFKKLKYKMFLQIQLDAINYN